jgi:thioredoxin reductase (NADPH)
VRRTGGGAGRRRQLGRSGRGLSASEVAKVWLRPRTKPRSEDVALSLDRIAGLPNVEVLTQTSITGLEGRGDMPDSIRWRGQSGEEQRAVRHLFLFIGADPNTDWLAGSGVTLDPKGFVLTARRQTAQVVRWRRAYVAYDVRSGSMKRVAAAVGEGAQVVATLHAFLANADRSPPISRGSERVNA